VNCFFKNNSSQVASADVLEIRKFVDLLRIPTARCFFSSPRFRLAWFYSRSHDAVIHVYDETGNMIETHEHKGEFREWLVFYSHRVAVPAKPISMIPLSSRDHEASKQIRLSNSVKHPSNPWRTVLSGNNRMKVVGLLSMLVLLFIVLGSRPLSLSADPISPHQQLARDILAELVDINTVTTTPAPNRALGLQSTAATPAPRQRGRRLARSNELVLIGSKPPQLGPAAAATR
jgi:hypothetical protein